MTSRPVLFDDLLARSPVSDAPTPRAITDDLEIRSSWAIDSRGHSTRIDRIDPHRSRAEGHDYRCGSCGERGHSRRTCGREPVR